MKVLLVNNDSDTFDELQDLCIRSGYDVNVVHCTAIPLQSISKYDLAVLSGGYWYDDPYQHLETYKLELELIRTCPIPIVGICIGMLLMHTAVNQEVPHLDEPQSGLKAIHITPHGQLVLGLPETITVHKNHTMGIVDPLPHFIVLGTSPGHVEILRHTTQPMLGMQFHPEIGDPEAMVELFKKLVDTVITPDGKPRV